MNLYIGCILDVRIRLNLLIIPAIPLLLLFGDVVLLVNMFTAVLLHELSHAFAARMFGLRVQSLDIMPLGGVAVVEGLEFAGQGAECVIALVGPVFSFFCATACICFGAWMPFMQDGFRMFAQCSMAIAVFNMLPSFPMDGGRALRAALSFAVNEKTAESICIFLSFLIAAGMVAAGIYYLAAGSLKPMVFGVAAMLLLSAFAEMKKKPYAVIKTMAGRKGAMGRRGNMKIRYIAAEGSETGGKIVAMFRPNRYHIVCVLDGRGGIIGHITQDMLLEGMIGYGTTVKLKDLL